MNHMIDIWIKWVEIINFQSHKKTTIHFNKGTNALIGTSNSGKSAVIRAIRWCLLNYPNGTDFIRTGEKEAIVRVALSNNKIIVRRRGKGNVNEYQLYEGDTLLEEFTGFGAKPPAAIIEAHGIVPIANDVYFHFAPQLDAPFMLSLKPKQRAEVLGNLEELARIDRALTDVNSDILVSNKEKKRLEKEEKQLLLEFEKLQKETQRLDAKIDTLKQLKQGIDLKMELQAFLEKQLARLYKIQEDILGLEKDAERATRVIAAWPETIEDRVKEYQHIERLITRLKDIKQELNSLRFMKEEKLSDLELLSNEVQQKIDKFQELTQLVRKVKQNTDDIERNENSYSDRVAEYDYSHMDIEVTKYQMLFKHLERMGQINKEIQSNSELIETATVQIDKVLNEFVDALQNAGICPTCGQDTDDVCAHTLENVI